MSATRPGVLPKSKLDYLQADCSDFADWVHGFVKRQQQQHLRKVGEDGKGKCYICKVECSTRCKKCKEAPDGRFSPFYCGIEHQLLHWENGHKKGCSPWNTLMALAYGVHKDVFPAIGAPDYINYGFGNCKTMNEETNLLGLYTGLIKNLECDLDELHEACINERLDKFIIQEFERAKGNEDRVSLGGYYEWFLDNQHVVQGIAVIRSRIKKGKPSNAV